MVTVTELVTWKSALKRKKKVFSQPNQLTTKTAGDRIKTATKKMKKILLVLITLMGISFAAKAQSCQIANDGTYIAVDAFVSGQKIECNATCYGSSQPTSGTIYVTVYFKDNKGNDDEEMITIQWTENKDGILGYISGQCYPYCRSWKGRQSNVDRIIRWEVSAGACQFKN